MADFNFPTSVFGLQNAIIIDKLDIYKGLPKGDGVDTPLKYSEFLGTPVYSDLTLKGGTYSNNEGKVFTFDDVYFETVIMVIEQEKRIIETEIQGRDGSVNEYIGMSDYSVTINAVFTFANGQYDRDKVAQLKNLLIAPVAIKCVSWYLQLWDIDELIIKAYTIPQQQGQYSVQPIVLSARSNDSLEITEYQ